MSRRSTNKADVRGTDTIGRVRRICADLPECCVDGDQHHRLSVRGKTMGWHTVDHHGDGRIALTLKAARGENMRLVASDPRKFFMPSYVAHHGYVGVYLDTPEVDWVEICELIVDAYRLAAPKSLVKLIE
jgi:hypothetical protein